MLRKLALAAAAALPFVASAEAATVNLSNISVNSSGASVVHTEVTPDGLLEVLVAPYLVSGSFSSPTFTPTYGLTSYAGGLGINRLFDDHQVDGSGPNEAIVIQAQFNNAVGPVQFTDISFTYVSGDDEFSVFASSTGIAGLVGVYDDVDIPLGGTVSGNLSAATLAIAALESNDDWKLKSFSFNLIPGTDIENPIPVPAALPLMASALGGMALFRRRRQQS